jgi:cobalt-zinc-cadmium resistance protein CzcA
MIDRLLEFSLRQRAFVVLGTLALLGAGVWAALRLPIDATPDITNVQVQINTEVRRASPPRRSRKLVTFPIEMEMSGVPGMAELRSLSKTGLSQVTLVFGDDTDIYRARQLVSERLQNAAEEAARPASPRNSRPSPPASARSSTTSSTTRPTRPPGPPPAPSSSWSSSSSTTSS